MIYSLFLFALFLVAPFAFSQEPGPPAATAMLSLNRRMSFVYLRIKSADVCATSNLSNPLVWTRT